MHCLHVDLRESWTTSGCTSCFNVSAGNPPAGHVGPAGAKTFAADDFLYKKRTKGGQSA